MSGETVPAICSLCDGEACEEGCGNGGRSWCRRGSTGTYGPDAHRVCRRCQGSPARSRPKVWRLVVPSDLPSIAEAVGRLIEMIDDLNDGIEQGHPYLGREEVQRFLAAIASEAVAILGDLQPLAQSPSVLADGYEPKLDDGELF